MFQFNYNTFISVKVTERAMFCLSGVVGEGEVCFAEGEATGFNLN